MELFFSDKILQRMHLLLKLQKMSFSTLHVFHIYGLACSNNFKNNMQLPFDNTIINKYRSLDNASVVTNCLNLKLNNLLYTNQRQPIIQTAIQQSLIKSLQDTKIRVKATSNVVVRCKCLNIHEAQITLFTAWCLART